MPELSGHPSNGRPIQEFGIRDSSVGFLRMSLVCHRHICVPLCCLPLDLPHRAILLPIRS